MSEQDAAFNAALKNIATLVNGRHHNFEDALKAATELTEVFPDRTAAWFQVHLVLGLQGRHREAELCLNEARRCPDYTPVYEGDFMRDVLLAQMRRGEIPAYEHISNLRELHAGDYDRLACIDGLEGRYWYAMGEYALATHMHERANSHLANPVWEANNLLPWLKAVVMLGSWPGVATWLYETIERKCQAGRLTPGHLRRAKLCYKYGRFGCRLDDFASKAVARRRSK